MIGLFNKTIEQDEISDEAAIDLIRAGNTLAYEIIMRRYNQRLYRTARSVLKDPDAAEDAVQQAYISAFYKLDTYTPKGKLGAWLTRITLNESLMIKRKPDNKIANASSTLDEAHLEQKGDKPDANFANKELARLIEAAIEQLPSDFRTVFVLRAIQQLSTKETAESLELYEATVKTRFYRAKKLMRQRLNQHIEQAGMQVYEFAGQRCDRIVHSVSKSLDVENERDNQGKP